MNDKLQDSSEEGGICKVSHQLYLAPVNITDILWPFLCSAIPEEVPAGKALPYLRSLAEFG